MKARILRFSFLAVLSMFVTFGLYAQPAGYQQHGNNSGGTPDASENIDSVTIGATMGYFVMPDLTVNVDGDGPYDYATNADALTSTFDWTGSTIGTIPADTDNEISIDFGSIGTGQIIVVEQSSAGCGSGSQTAIDVEVIAVPTGDFTSINDALCNTPASVDYDFPVSLSTAEKNGVMRVILSVDGPSTPSIYSNTYDVNESAGTLNIPAGSFDDGYGDYTITITEVSDRISRKSSVAGTITTGNFTLTINRVPTTGNIYHVPNK